MGNQPDSINAGDEKLLNPVQPKYGNGSSLKLWNPPEARPTVQSIEVSDKFKC